MKYFIDTEFHEYKKKPWLSKPINTIELISIGIVAKDGREYYAISKDFDMKAAWCAEQDEHEDVYMAKHNYWLRENVLKPIWIELHEKEKGDMYMREQFFVIGGPDPCKDWFHYRSLKRLINKYGKSNAQIANEVVLYIYGDCDNLDMLSPLEIAKKYEINDKELDPEFYGYYSASDWVVFYWLFGKLIERPKGFPMYCRDLKQMLDEKESNLMDTDGKVLLQGDYDDEQEAYTVFQFDSIKDVPGYPKQSNEHNALDDANWNHNLFEFINSLT